jgi:hypothetical protein
MAVSGVDAGEDIAELERSERFKADMGKARWNDGGGRLGNKTRMNSCNLLYRL